MEDKSGGVLLSLVVGDQRVAKDETRVPSGRMDGIIRRWRRATWVVGQLLSAGQIQSPGPTWLVVNHVSPPLGPTS